MAYNCPNCGSDNTQSFPSIRESGSYSGTTNTVGSAYVDGKYLPYAGTAHHSGRSGLAKKLAPPQPVGSGCWFYILLGFLGIPLIEAALMGIGMLLPHALQKYTVMFSFGLVPCVGYIWLIVRYVRSRRRAKGWNDDGYSDAMSRWKRSMHCHRCGGDFVR